MLPHNLENSINQINCIAFQEFKKETLLLINIQQISIDLIEMKNTLILNLLLILTFLITFKAEAKPKTKDKYRLNIDTISNIKDSVFARIVNYRNDTLYKESMCFLLPDSDLVPRYWRLPNLFKKKSYFSRVLKHGITIDYDMDRKKKLTEYQYDNAISTLYYDEANHEIPANSFNRGINQRGPCGSKIVEIIITGQRKR